MSKITLKPSLNNFNLQVKTNPSLVTADSLKDFSTTFNELEKTAKKQGVDLFNLLPNDELTLLFTTIEKLITFDIKKLKLIPKSIYQQEQYKEIERNLYLKQVISFNKLSKESVNKDCILKLLQQYREHGSGINKSTLKKIFQKYENSMAMQNAWNLMNSSDLKKLKIYLSDICEIVPHSLLINEGSVFKQVNGKLDLDWIYEYVPQYIGYSKDNFLFARINMNRVIDIIQHIPQSLLTEEVICKIANNYSLLLLVVNSPFKYQGKSGEAVKEAFYSRQSLISLCFEEEFPKEWLTQKYLKDIFMSASYYSSIQIKYFLEKYNKPNYTYLGKLFPDFSSYSDSVDLINLILNRLTELYPIEEIFKKYDFDVIVEKIFSQDNVEAKFNNKNFLSLMDFFIRNKDYDKNFNNRKYNTVEKLANNQFKGFYKFLFNPDLYNLAINLETDINTRNLLASRGLSCLEEKYQKMEKYYLTALNLKLLEEETTLNNYKELGFKQPLSFMLTSYIKSRSAKLSKESFNWFEEVLGEKCKNNWFEKFFLNQSNVLIDKLILDLFYLFDDEEYKFFQRIAEIILQKYALNDLVSIKVPFKDLFETNPILLINLINDYLIANNHKSELELMDFWEDFFNKCFGENYLEYISNILTQYYFKSDTEDYGIYSKMKDGSIKPNKCGKIEVIYILFELLSFNEKTLWSLNKKEVNKIFSSVKKHPLLVNLSNQVFSLLN
jgi:hypothetical protein